MKRALAVAILVASPLCADDVFLRGGGHVKGIVVERSQTTIVVDVGAGRVGIPASHVLRIVEGRTALAAYNERVGRLADDDAKGWLELALWAQEQDLQTQAREAFVHVVGLDPSNATAQMALGRVLLGEAWVSAEQAYRAQGYVLFEGSWILPAERESILAERRAVAETERIGAEAEARVREAEARARIAEAEADRAEADAASSDGGIPLGYGFGYGGYGYGFVGAPVVGSGHRHHDGRPCNGCGPRARPFDPPTHPTTPPRRDPHPPQRHHRTAPGAVPRP